MALVSFHATTFVAPVTEQSREAEATIRARILKMCEPRIEPIPKAWLCQGGRFGVHSVTWGKPMVINNDGLWCERHAPR